MKQIFIGNSYRRWVSVAVGAGLILAIFLISTNPNKLPLPFLLIPFVLLYVILWAVFFAILLRFESTKVLSTRVRRITATLLSLLPFSLLVFQSLHQLSIKDVMLAVALVIGVGFYVSRADYLR